MPAPHPLPGPGGDFATVNTLFSRLSATLKSRVRLMDAMSSLITFDVWRTRFREDCEEQDKLAAFNALTDYVLRILWEQGLEPTVESVSQIPAAEQ